MATFTLPEFWDHANQVSDEVSIDLDNIIKKLEDLKRDAEESEKEGVPADMKNDLQSAVQKVQDVYDSALAGIMQKIENHQEYD